MHAYCLNPNNHIKVSFAIKTKITNKTGDKRVDSPHFVCSVRVFQETFQQERFHDAQSTFNLASGIK